MGFGLSFPILLGVTRGVIKLNKDVIRRKHNKKIEDTVSVFFWVFFKIHTALAALFLVVFEQSTPFLKFHHCLSV